MNNRPLTPPSSKDRLAALLRGWPAFIAVALLVIAAAATLLLNLPRRALEDQRKLLNAESIHAAAVVTDYLSAKERFFALLQSETAAGGFADALAIERAEKYARVHTGLVCMFYVAPDHTVVWATASPLQHHLEGQPLTDPLEAETAILAAQSLQAAYSAPHRLATGETGFILVYPLTRGGQLAGFLGAAFTVEGVMQRISEEIAPNGYQYSLLDESAIELASLPPAADIDSRLIQTTPLDLPGYPYALRVAVREHSLFSDTDLTVQALIVLIVLASLAALIYFAWERSRLAQAEAAYRAILDNSLQGILIYQDGRLVYTNAAFAAIVGYSQAELSQMPPEEVIHLFHPEDRTRAAEIIAARLRGQAAPPRQDYRLLHKDGGTLWVEAYSTPIKYRGRPAIQSTQIDITERRQAEAALQASEQRYKALFEDSSVTMLLIDPLDGQIVDANAAACQFYGYDHAQITALKVSDINTLPPDEVRARIAQTQSSGRGHFFFSHRLADGSIRAVEVRSGPLEIDGKQILFSIVHDVSEQEATENALHTSESTLQSLMRASPAAIGMVTRRVFNWVNTRMLLMTGYASEELIGQSARMIYASEEEFQRVGTIKYAQIRGQGVGAIETRFKRKDGSVFDVLLSSSPIDQSDWEKGVVFTAVDITEFKQASTLLEESEARYRQLFDTMLTGFALHEIICDEAGKAVDYRFLEVNPAFEKFTGLRAADVVGRTVLEVLPETEPYWIETYSRVALTGDSLHFEHHHAQLGKYFEVHTYRPAAGQFASLFMDITERRVHQNRLEALVTLSERLRSAHNRSEMAPVILNTVREALQADGTLLGMLDAHKTTLTAELAVGSAASRAGAEMPANQGIIGEALQRRRLLVEENVHTNPQLAAYVRKEDPDFMAAMPLIASDEPIGVLLTSRRTPFSEADLAMLQSCGEVAANAMHRAALHEQTQRSLRRLESLHKIDQAINSILDLQVTLSIVLDQVLAQLDGDAASILLYHPHLQSLEYRSARGFVNPNIQNTRVLLNQSLAGRAAVERRTVSWQDLRQKANGLRLPQWSDENFVAYHAAPLIARGEVRGVLEVFHRAPFAPEDNWLNFLGTLAGQAAIAIDSATLLTDLQRSNMELAQAYDTTLEGWALALEMRDHETHGHSRRVADATLRLAEALKVHPEELVHIRRGALLHDIGKMAISDSILRKAGPLNEDEWRIMRRHPELAYDLLASIPFLQRALDIPYCHHEHWDGSGYPRGLQGEQIPLAARAFTLVDVWDALLSDRPYRPAWAEAKVLAYLREQSGKLFDPRVVEVFFKVIE
ncbi:MAG: PAS domain S-box protein [Chloroflexi bacterium]|nr:PAS domain S-box protein [Chloroflexota bacterium]